MESASTLCTESVEQRPRISARSPASEISDDPILLSSHRRSVQRARNGRFAKQLAVLAIGVSDETDLAGATVTRAACPREAIELLRMADYSLLLVDGDADDKQLWNTVSLIRRHWPGLPWALAREVRSDKEEILVRSLGVTVLGLSAAEIVRGFANRIKSSLTGN